MQSRSLKQARRTLGEGAPPEFLQAEHARIQKELLREEGWVDPLRGIHTENMSPSHLRLASQVFAAPLATPPTQELFAHDHAFETHARWLLDLPLGPDDATCSNVK